MESLKDVFEHEIKDLYSAESQLVKALPKMAKGAVNEDLRHAFEQHLQQTQQHVQRLEKVAEQCDFSLRGEKCKGMEGLITEGDNLLKQEDENEVRDAALIPAAQRVEHYEIAAYGSAVAFAKMLDLSDAESLLQQTLDEEKQADQKLTMIAEQMVNMDAEDGVDGQQGMNGNRTGAKSSRSTSSSTPKRSS